MSSVLGFETMSYFSIKAARGTAALDFVDFSRLSEHWSN